MNSRGSPDPRESNPKDPNPGGVLPSSGGSGYPSGVSLRFTDSRGSLTPG